MSADDPDVGVDEFDGVGGGVVPAPFGRSTSSHVTFSGTQIDQIDRTPPQEEEDGNMDGIGEAPSSSSSSSSSIVDRELGDSAVWILSSAKVGNGVEQLRDGDPLTFWQSDGILPHALTIQFHKMTRISCICLYLDQKLDESYSPSRISIRVGNGSASGDVTQDGQPLQQGIRELDKFELEDPQGWIVCHLTRTSEDGGGGTSMGVETKIRTPVRCHFVQVVILNSFQNGRDTHIRQVKIFGPRQGGVGGVGDGVVVGSNLIRNEPDSFTSLEFKQFAMIR